MQIVKRFSNKIRSIYAAGSPLRYVRKAALISADPLAKIQRLRAAPQVDPGRTGPFSVEALKELRRSGLAKLQPGLDPSLLKDLRAAIDQKLSSGEESALATRSYFSTVLGESDLTSRSPFVRFALDEGLLNLVSDYFGEVPRLSYVDILVSKPTGLGYWTESQLWHQDYDDSKIVKFFVYHNDVTQPGTGPFTYLPAEYSGKVKNRLIPSRVTDDEMEKQGFARFAQPVFGPAETGFLIDTSRCYHMGSRCTEGKRIAYCASFTTFAPLYPETRKIRLESECTPLQKLVLEG